MRGSEGGGVAVSRWEEGEVKLSQEGGVAKVVLDRPRKLNAVTPAMTEVLWDICERVNRTEAIRVMVLTGAGERAFCVGSDVGELDGYDSAWAFRNRLDYCDAIRSVQKPVIAAVNGYALGGGLEMAMSCDIRLASSTASFGAPEIKLGWVGGGGQAVFLSRSVGASNAALMLYSGESVGAERALSWGLVSEVMEPERLGQVVAELAGRLATRPPIALQTAKLNLRAAHTLSVEDAVRYERDLQTICFATEDAAEGRLAFKEKRSPQFQGR